MSKIIKAFIAIGIGVVLLTGLTEVASAQEFDRGIENQVFVPRGQWLLGGSFSYQQFKTDDYTFVVLENINLDGYTLNISPFAGYFLRDNLAVGLRFGYNRSLADIGSVELGFLDNTDFNINDYHYVKHVYSGTAMVRSYINLGDSKRFGLFTEGRLTLGGGQGKVTSGVGADLSGTYQDIFEVHLGLTPGLTAFITNNVAVEATVGIMGLQYKMIKQTKDQVYKGTHHQSGLNFKFDIMSINLGLSFYLNSKKY